MDEIKIMSFAKVNLSIDVGSVQPSGMHPVDMIMHQIAFHDDVTVVFESDQSKDSIEIELTSNKFYLPTDGRNLAFKAAELMASRYGDKISGGKVRIDIYKRIPVAAGMAGGSGNGAAVIHALNVLWKLHLDLENLCRLGSELGSDVPFCVMGQARQNYVLPRKIRKDPFAVSCARATGTGTSLQPLPSIRKSLIVAKPPIGVSTKEVYQGIDSCSITARPDNDSLIRGIDERNFDLIYKNCINVLEEYTLHTYAKVGELKELMLKDKKAEMVLMSGSGPTVFAIYGDRAAAKAATASLRKHGYEVYWTVTTA